MLLENERLDDLHRKNYKIIQNNEFFCFGIDAVLLSSFAKAKKQSKILDLCTGNAIVPILLKGKYDTEEIAAIEIQDAIYSMAKRSVEYNSLGNVIDVIHDNINNYSKYYNHGYFDIVTVNPPYMANRGKESMSKEKAIARHEITCDLNLVLKVSSSALKYGGKFYMVHRPDRLADILCTMREYKIEPKTLQFVVPHQNKPPNIVLVEGIKGGKSSVNVLPNLIVYDGDKYTQEVYKMYYE
ncbi:MAG: tRNA1(Val) (adenine(37)-N6)-methyltransferase [Lachnospirales bacterium]